MTITAKMEVVTPEKARGWLTDGVHNRALVESHVNWLSRQMREGKWDENGQGITLDERGRLLDGQHRMNALVLAGVPVKMLVIRGVDGKTFDTIDTGRPRYGRDILSIEGYESAEKFSAILTLIHRWYMGLFPSGGGRKDGARASVSEILALAKKHPEAHDSVRWAFNRDRSERIVTARTTIAFAHWATTRARPTIAKRFWAAYATGEGERGSPAIALRNKFLVSFTTHDREKKLSESAVIATCAIAWRYEIEETRFSMLKWNPRDGWPQFIGCEMPVPVRDFRAKAMNQRKDKAVLVGAS